MSSSSLSYGGTQFHYQVGSHTFVFSICNACEIIIQSEVHAQ